MAGAVVPAHLELRGEVEGWVGHQGQVEALS